MVRERDNKCGRSYAGNAADFSRNGCCIPRIPTPTIALALSSCTWPPSFSPPPLHTCPTYPSPSSFDQPLYLADPPPPPHHANTSGQYSTDYFTARYQWHSGAKQPALGFQALGVVHWQEPPGRSNVPTEALGKHASGIGAAFVLGRCSMVHNALGVARRLFRYRCQGKSQACLGSTCWHRRTLSAQLASHRATLQLFDRVQELRLCRGVHFRTVVVAVIDRERERERAQNLYAVRQAWKRTSIETTTTAATTTAGSLSHVIQRKHQSKQSTHHDTPRSMHSKRVWKCEGCCST
jgi:hypothetical protein